MNKVRLRLSATSANVGPGFDTLALALQLYLHIEAETAATMEILASGRNAEVCGAVENNLLLKTYAGIMEEQGRTAAPLALRMRNEIPLGMGCGSSAAVRIAGVVLASQFGNLGWDGDRIMAEASRLEGHPDNVAACWLGGFAASAWDGEKVRAASLLPPADWQAVLVLPERPLATSVSRAVLPDRYTRAEVVENLQNTALLTAAFASGRADLVRAAMRDRLHQPFRSRDCPMLPALQPLAREAGVLGVALSGAGPAVLLLVESLRTVERVIPHARRIAESGENGGEILVCGLQREPLHLEMAGADNQLKGVQLW